MSSEQSMQWQVMDNWAVFEDKHEYLIYLNLSKAVYLASDVTPYQATASIGFIPFAKFEVAIYLQSQASPFSCESHDYARKEITHFAKIIQPKP